jgi:uncharacterized membrane protein
MPYDMASHWNAAGEVDGYISKFWGLFLMPIISVAMFLLFVFLPLLDPLKDNVKKFRSYYDGFMIMMTAFMFYLYVLTLMWNIGYKFNMLIWLTPSFAILFYYSGMLMEHAKRNWFIGIKTPWTLSSDDVWDKTHKLGAKLFKLTGIICLLGMILPVYAIWFVLVPVLSTSVVTIVYSYVLYKRKGKKK